MSKTVGIVILAAGKGTRMKMDAPKPLVPCAGKKLIDYPLGEALHFLEKRQLSGEITLVTGYQKEKIESYVSGKYDNECCRVSFVYQKEQLGTAHALMTYFDNNPNAKNYTYTMVLCADTPLIRSDDLASLFEKISKENLDAVAATFAAENPHGYGRIVRDNPGFSIIEHKDANEEVLKINEVNSGLYFIRTEFALKHITNIDTNNKAGEFYLTDLFKKDFRVSPVKFLEGKNFLGVNDLKQLEEMEMEIRKKRLEQLREEGVRFIDSKSVYLDEDVAIGEGTLIYPNVCIEKGATIGKNVTIESGCFIKSSQIEDSAFIKANCYLDQATVRAKATIGPFAHLRPDADIGPNAKIGNFVEIKKSKLDEGVKVSHLSYVGDAEIGKESNIGCGFITCNYDGAKKHVTKIGEDCFIGSDTQMVAPIEIGDRCYVASGSTINQSMEDGDFAIARSRQVTKKGLAKKFLKHK